MYQLPLHVGDFRFFDRNPQHHEYYTHYDLPAGIRFAAWLVRALFSMAKLAYLNIIQLRAGRSSVPHPAYQG